MKDISFLNKNIRFLRKQKGLTQDGLAIILEIKRSALGAYEEGRADPKIPALHRIANFFGITLDQLISVDLSEVADASIHGRSLPPGTYIGAPDMEGKRLRVLSITVDNKDRENIELVPQKAAAGYLAGYADPEYMEDLPRFQLPMLPANGTYRAFEITGDSMLPLTSGTTIIGAYVENWNSIKDGQPCILVTNSEGVVYKRVYKKGEKLTLKSDNPAYPAYTVNLTDVVEIWSAKAYISTDFPEAEISIQQLAGIVMDLQREVIRLKEA